MNNSLISGFGTALRAFRKTPYSAAIQKFRLQHPTARTRRISGYASFCAGAPRSKFLNFATKDGFSTSSVIIVIAILLIGGGIFLAKNAGETPEDIPGTTPAEDNDTKGSEGCMVTGCSGQICADGEVVTTCEFREEYGCYVTATCERQTSGECGWTETPELLSCLGEKKGTEVMDQDSKVGEEGEEVTVKTFNLTGTNYTFFEKEIRVKIGDRVKIIFTSGQGFHDWTVDEFRASTSRVNTGKTTEVEFIADKTGTFEYYCSVGNHRALGMVGILIVE